MPIPKKLFQTARSYNALPEDIKKNIARLQEANPSWTYKLYEDAETKDYIRQNVSPDDWHEIEQVNPKYGVVLADLFRYIIIFNEGGVYLDVKSTAKKPLSNVVEPELRFVVSQWPNKLGQRFAGYGLHPELVHVPGGEFQQWCIIAEPGHAFLKAVLKQALYNIRTYTPGQFGTDAYGVLRVSGPIAYTKAIYPLLDHCPHTFVNLDDWGIQYSIYEDIGQNQKHSKVSGHYSSVKEPIVLKDVYVDPEPPLITRLGDLLARELRDNIDLVLKFAVISVFSTVTIFILLAISFVWFAAR